MSQMKVFLKVLSSNLYLTLLTVLLILSQGLSEITLGALLRSTSKLMVNPVCQSLFATSPKLEKSLVINTLNEKHIFIESIRATLKSEFVGWDDFVDDLIVFAKERLLVFPGRAAPEKAAKVLILLGDTGVGKTSVLTRFIQLLGEYGRKEYVHLNKGTVEFPSNRLRELADQRVVDAQIPKISLLVIDEVQNFKPWSELETKKMIPRAESTQITLNGNPVYDEVNEELNRVRSLTVFKNALGNGKDTRTPDFTPQEYVNQLTELTSKYKRAKTILKTQNTRQEKAENEMASKDGLAYTIKSTDKRMADAENKILSVEKEVHLLLEKCRLDQPYFFSKAQTNSKDIRGIPENIQEFDGQQLKVLWERNPQNFLKFMNSRKDLMISTNPEETFHNAIIAIVGNPEPFILKVRQSFQGFSPSADELVQAYDTLVNPNELNNWFFGLIEDTPAMRNRFHEGSIVFIPPLNQIQYEELIHRSLRRQEMEYVKALANIGIHNTSLKFDQSVFDLIRTEAIVPLSGTREFLPRVDRIISEITQDSILSVALQSQEKGVPRELVISFNSKNRQLETRVTKSNLGLVFADYSIPNFKPPRMDPDMLKFEREKRGLYLASTAVVGMVLHGSLPLTMDINMRFPSLSQFWKINDQSYSALRTQMMVMRAGILGEQKFAPGALVSIWTRMMDTYLSETVGKTLEDIQYRQENASDIGRTLPEANPMKQLAFGFKKLLKKNDSQKTSAEVMMRLNQDVVDIIHTNRKLVILIARHLVENETMTPEELTIILQKYSEQTPQIKSWVSSVFGNLGPLGKEKLVRTQNISGEPGKPTSRNLLDAADQSLLERIVTEMDRRLNNRPKGDW